MEQVQPIIFIVAVGVALFALAALVAKAVDDTYDDVWQRERYKDMYRGD